MRRLMLTVEEWLYLRTAAERAKRRTIAEAEAFEKIARFGDVKNAETARSIAESYHKEEAIFEQLLAKLEDPEIVADEEESER